MFKNLSLLVALVLFSVATTFAQKLPNIHILATGGTIAGTGASSPGPITQPDRLPSVHFYRLYPKFRK